MLHQVLKIKLSLLVVEFHCFLVLHNLVEEQSITFRSYEQIELDKIENIFLVLHILDEIIIEYPQLFQQEESREYSIDRCIRKRVERIDGFKNLLIDIHFIKVDLHHFFNIFCLLISFSSLFFQLLKHQIILDFYKTINLHLINMLLVDFIDHVI